MLQFTTVDRVISKFYRDTGDTDISVDDLIEWTGEALDHMRVHETQVQGVAFIEVKNYQAKMPCGLQSILQIARDTQWTGDNCPVKELQEESGTDLHDIVGAVIQEDGYQPYIFMRWGYVPWTCSGVYAQRFNPVRLADSTFFGSLVCKEKDMGIYQSSRDEYSIAGTFEKKLTFSFETGYVAVSYMKTAMDEETGYPLIPDNISYIEAIKYYILWKITEWKMHKHREGAMQMVGYYESKWKHYCAQGKNYMTMPKTIDDYQDLLEMSFQLIPDHKKYYGYFGNLTEAQQRPWAKTRR